MDFFVKLVPPRTSFAQDIDAREQEIMQRHGDFWTDLVRKGIAIVCGPVLDPAGIYGIGVIGAESRSALHSLLEHDPAVGLLHYEIPRMRAVHPGQQPPPA
jgi:uncharacterized protein